MKASDPRPALLVATAEPRPRTLPPALQLGGQITFAGTISFAPVAARVWG